MRVTLLALLALGTPAPSEAQGFRLSGHVYSVTDGDTIGLANHWIVLHQVSASGGAPVDSGRTDRFGGYFLRSPVRDTSAVYVASVGFRGITYFAPPVPAVEFTTDTAETMFVYDTSSVGPELTVAQRYVVVRSPEIDGTRSVLELVTLQNRGTLTRVSSDSTRPVWRGAIPRGAMGLEIGEGDVSPDAFFHLGDTVALVAPVPPGEKQIVFAYTLPARRDVVVPVDPAVVRMEVLIENDAELVEGPLERVGDQTMDSLSFARFAGEGVAAGTSLSFRVARPPVNLLQFWWVVVAAAAMAFLATIVLWWRRLPAAAGADDPQVLAARIAALDESFDVKQPPSPAERTAYEKNRELLKTRLTAALAKRGRPG